MPVLTLLALAAQQPEDIRLLINTAPVRRSARVAGQLPGGALARFSDVPNVSIDYYDVAGREIAGIRKAVARGAPRDPQTNRILAASSAWTVAVKVRTLTSGSSCTVTGAILEFRGSATMPRLAADPERLAPVAAAWAAYAAQLEARQAAQLRFAYEHLGDLERAIRASRCGQAEVVTAEVLERLRERQRLTFAEQARNEPKLEEPLP